MSNISLTHANHMDLLPLLEAICRGKSKRAAIGLLRRELQVWKGDCPAPPDSEYVRDLTQELEAALFRLEAAESVELFLDGERRRLSPTVRYLRQEEKIHRKGMPEHGCYILSPPYGFEKQ